MLPPSAAERMAERVRAVADSREPHQYRDTLPWAGGEVVLQSTFSPVEDGQGRVTGVLSIGRDVTERLQMEKTLASSEARYRSIFAQAPIAVLHYDEQARLLDANQRALDLFGIPDLAAVRGVCLFDNPRITDEHRERLARGETVRFEWRASFAVIQQRGLYEPTRSDSAYVEWLIAPLRDGGYLVQARETTQQREVREALRRSEAVFRRAVVLGPLPMLIWDCQGVVEDVNRAALDLLGAPDWDDVLGQALPRACQVTAAQRGLLARDGVVRFEAPLDYGLLASDVAYEPLRSGVTRLLWTLRSLSEGRTIAYIQDVGQRRRAERELAFSEARYRHLVELAPELIAVLDVDEILYVNRAGVALLGAREAREIVGRSIDEFVLAEDREATRKRIRDVLAGERAPGFPMDLTIVDVEGKAILAEIVGAPILLDGRPAVQILLWDVGAARRAEQRVAHAEWMAAQGRLALGFADAVNNPLQTIRSGIEYIGRFAPSVEDQAECLAMMAKEVDRLDRLTGRMLDLGRPRLEMPQLLHLPMLLAEVLVSFEPQIEAAAVRIVDEVPADLPPLIAVRSQMAELLRELIENGLEALPRGGCLEFSGWSSEREVVFSIANDGPHIPRPYLERIFEPLFSDKAGGQEGLGLYICHEITRRHGGTMDVVNLPHGEGVRFTVRLPMRGYPEGQTR